jgi:glutamate/tyrosine decarboxylase-like PLP-dependent enzyme
VFFAESCIHKEIAWHTDPRCAVYTCCIVPGGTESILLAVKASRDYMAATRGITDPELVIGVSAHAAYYKAAEYFNIKLVKAPLGPDYR